MLGAWRPLSRRSEIAHVIDADRIDQGSEEVAQARDHRLLSTRWSMQGRQLCQVGPQSIQQVSVWLHEKSPGKVNEQARQASCTRHGHALYISSILYHLM